MKRKTSLKVGGLALVLVAMSVTVLGQIGKEVAIPEHLSDGQEFQLSAKDLINFGKQLFVAEWTHQEGGGRPMTKGTGNPLSDPTDPLLFPRDFNRVSAPDANSCAGCHNKPVVGGGGDIVANVFVLGQRFDFARMGNMDSIPTKDDVDELGNHVTLQSIANSRKTVGMNGSGFIEMLARQITADLQAERNATAPGGSMALTSKGISFGTIKRNLDGTWDTSMVQGIPGPSLATTGASDPPSLIIRPFHQVGNVISVRQFTNNAFNHHHGIQPTERFGIGIDADGDGFINEMTRADVTAATIFQVTMAVPGRVISDDPAVNAAVINGEAKFASIGCTSCHMPSLPLNNNGWIFTEPNPFNPAGNLRTTDGVPILSIDLTDKALPEPRLSAKGGVVNVPAFTDLKLHEMTSGPGDPNREGLNQNAPAGSTALFAGNGKFITRKLWGVANQHKFGHTGQFTTMRESILLGHKGEALGSSMAFSALSAYDQNSIIEFLKSLQILPEGTKSLCINEKGKKCKKEGEDDDD